MSEIVISGISGRFPQSDNVEEFKINLMKKIYLVGDPENRIKFKLDNCATNHGLLRNLDKFDLGAFRIPSTMANCVDPQARILSENVFEAILDAGISPKSLMGSNTGVYVGCFNYDSFEHWMSNKESPYGFTSITNSSYALSNRISYNLGCQGPSITVDTACSSSMYALNLAFKDIKNGECESAIVIGSNLILNPYFTKDLSKSGAVSVEGISKPFDKNCSGYVRSEACCVLFLQKADKARRVYATILNSCVNNDGYKTEGATAPSAKMQKELYRKAYESIQLDPNKIDFLEAHVTSTEVGDRAEVISIDEFFCINRDRSLLVGGVKGNMGHSEAASGAVSIVKSILMFENEKVIPNININELRDCPGFNENRMKVATEVEDFHGKIIGVNNFGVLGTNSHTIVQRNEKSKVNRGLPTDNIPRLLLWAGRTIESVDSIFDNINSKSIDDEFLALLQTSQIESYPTFNKRGYAIFQSDLNNQTTVCVDRQIKTLDKSHRSIVFVYSGVGSQWLEMGKDLMRIPLISESIDKCHDVLLKHGCINLKHILTSNSPDTFTTCINIFIGITSIQIALTDLLRKIGVKPNFYIGHSVGELCCAYADENLTLEETILTAYYRGITIIEGAEKTGSMAAIAMSYEELKKVLPDDIEIACHNSQESCTISGPYTSIENFVKEMKSKQVLSKIIDSSGVAFHSSLIANCGPLLAERLKKVIINPKKRSSKWISTSLIEGQDEFSTINYHVNNMLSTVRFAEALEKVPEDSIFIEISPHGLLQPILKQSHPSAVCESLTRRGADDGVVSLLQSLGRIYQNGVDMNIREMYPKVDFPVSRGTQMISPLIKWQHDESFTVPIFDPFSRCDKRNLTINMKHPKYSFLRGHQIDGRILMPATGYLIYVSETYAMMHGKLLEEFPTCFQDIKFIKAAVLTDNQDLELSILIQRGSGDFEVVEKNETLCKGRIQPLEDNNEFVFNTLGDIKINKNKETTLIKEDFYKELRLRGYEYKDEFQLVDISENFVKPQRFGQIEWRNNLISFTDCMVQTFVTNKDIRSLEIPISIERCLFDPVKHLEMIKNKENVQTLLDHDDVVKIVFDLMIDEELNIYRSGGFEIINPEAHNVSRKKNTKNPTLESYEFIPHNESLEMTKNNAAKFCIQLFVENSIYGGKFSFVEVNYEDDNPLIASIVNAVNETPLIVPTYRLLTNQSVEEIKDVIILNSDELNNLGPIDILITSETNKHILKTLDKINDKGLLLLRKSDSLSISLPESFKPIAKVNCESEIVSVFRKTPIIGTNPQIFEVPSSFESFEWVEEFKKLLELSQDIIIHSRSQCSGALGFFKCLRRESVGEKLRCFIIEDESAPKFDITNEFYKNQLDLGLALNIFKDQRWGSYHHLTISQDIDEKPHSDHVFVHQLTKGDVSSLCWVKGEIENTQSNDIIDVHYSAFNFRDILVATSRISLDYEYSNRITAQYQTGLEFSGIKKDGKRVAGMGESRSFCNYIENCVYFEVPDSYTLEEAATIPVVYATVYLAFFIKSQIEPGKSILIHAGSGGLGQAAIRTALNYGLKVFTTCGSKEKREFLLNEFPELEEENIGNSRDLSFEKMIIKRTNGRGVDYVMNSLAEDKMQASLRCLAEGGIFYEVGKFDIHTGNKISLKHFLKEIKYIGIFLTSKLLKGNEKLIEKLNEDMKLGKLKPIKRVVFKANEVEKAFRFMMNGKHTGKVLIQIRENDESQISLPIHVKPRVYFDQEKVYIIPGGLGGMGMEIADWMIMRNCKKIVFSSSRGVSNSYQSYRIKIWESYGVKVEVSTANIATKEGCEELIKIAKKLGRVGGIFNLAVVLQNATIESQSEESFRRSFEPKALSTIYLDELSRSLCPDLDFFVFISSASCGRGNGGQTNYGYSNSVGEKIIEKRRQDNLPGKAIQYGPVGDVGLLAGYETEAVSLFGFLSQTMRSCLEIWDDILLRDEAVFSSSICAGKTSAKTIMDIFSMFLNALGITDHESVDLNQTLSNFGLDSLSGVEVQQIFLRELGISVSMKEFRSKTFREIRDICQKKT